MLKTCPAERDDLMPCFVGFPSIRARDLGGNRVGRRTAWAALFLAVLGCKGKETSPAPAARASAGTAASALPIVIDPEQGAARALLDAWLSAQNDGAFDAYAALYAEPFIGVKRVGVRSFRFNRRGWLDDRKPMLSAGARVSASHVTISKSGKHVVVAFEQTFQSPAFRDTGRKLLALAAGPQGLRIVREEMTTSTVDGGGGSTSALPGFFAAADDGIVLRSYIEDRWLVPERLKLSLLVRAPPNDDDPSGTELPHEGPLRMQDVVLPPEVLAMKGKRIFVTIGPEAPGAPLPPPCESSIAGIVLASSATPAFESVRGARRLDHVYGTYVRGVLDPPCPRGLWASETPPQPQYLPRRLQGVALADAERAFRAQPENGALQRAFLERPEASGNWYESGPTAFELGPSTGARLVFVAAYSQDAAERSGSSLSLLFERSDQERELRRIGLVDRNGFVVEPQLAFDLQGDGQLELLTAPSGDDNAVEVLFRKAGSLGRTTVHSAPDFVCPG